MWNKFFKIIFLILSFYLFSCEKPLKTPEVLDPIYNDILSETSKIEAEISEKQALLKEKIEDMKKSEPQTGRLDYHSKKYWALKSSLDRLKQKRLHLDIQLQLRQKEARIQYSRAWVDKSDWPYKDEFTRYNANKRDFNKRRDWDSKSRIEEYKMTNHRGVASHSGSNSGSKEAKAH